MLKNKLSYAHFLKISTIRDAVATGSSSAQRIACGLR